MFPIYFKEIKPGGWFRYNGKILMKLETPGTAVDRQGKVWFVLDTSEVVRAIVEIKEVGTVL